MTPADYVQKLRKYLEPNRKKFADWSKEGKDAKSGRWTGFLYDHLNGNRYILLPPQLIEEIFEKERVANAVAALRDSGLILPGERGAALKEIRIPATNEKARYYFVNRDFMKPNQN